MRSVKRSELICNQYPSKLNARLQEVIEEYNGEGLIVRIEKVYSESSRRGGSGGLFDYVLVVGYDE
jgi:hypothetical protein